MSILDCKLTKPHFSCFLGHSFPDGEHNVKCRDFCVLDSCYLSCYILFVFFVV